MTKHILHIGLELPEKVRQGEKWTHFPLIQTMPLASNEPAIQRAFSNFKNYKELIFTSKTAVRYTTDLLQIYQINKPYESIERIIAVGTATAKVVESFCGIEPLVAREETAEGVVEVLKEILSPESHPFWPHAAGARRLISDYLELHCRRFVGCVLYQTVHLKPAELPALSAFDAIYFSSPSTVDAFKALYDALPAHLEVYTQGKVTANHFAHAFGKLA